MLILIGVQELCDLCSPGMKELSLTVKKSLDQVLVVRLLAFGILDVILMFLILLLTPDLGVSVGQGILYMTVPFNVMCFGCAGILEKATPDYRFQACAAWGIFLMLGAMYLKNSYENLYRSNVLIFWLLAMGMTGAGVVWKWKILLKRVGGKENEIMCGECV